MNGHLSDSKTSLPPPPPSVTSSPQRLPPKMSSNVDLSAKPPISPTKMNNNNINNNSHSQSRQVTLIENGNEKKIYLKLDNYYTLFSLSPLIFFPFSHKHSTTVRFNRY